MDQMIRSDRSVQSHLKEVFGTFKIKRKWPGSCQKFMKSVACSTNQPTIFSAQLMGERITSCRQKKCSVNG